MFLGDYCHSNAYIPLQWPFSPNKQLEWIVANQISKEFFFLSAMPHSVHYRPQTCVWAAPDKSCLPKSMFLYRQKFVKFWPENYDFDLYKGFFIEKKCPKLQDFWKKKKFKLPDFSHNLQKVAKKIEGGILCFSLLLYLGCSQIWLNCFMDDSHFGYITN
jgi:hypothetical protein